jgi:hypothetical protein
VKVWCAWAPLLLLALAGCAAPTAAPTDGQPASPTRTPPPTATLGASPVKETKSYETRTDTQGSVAFEVTPIGLSLAAETFEFEVVMNTHTVDLAWDLAAQSVLRTESGLEVQALSWPLGSGHHYSGTLTFPSRSADGAALLDGARVLTLIIRDTDVPERAFTWEVQP